MKKKLCITKIEYAYVNKWVSNVQIDQKFPNHYWKTPSIFDARIMQTLKMSCAQYMGNYRQNIF